MVKRFGQDLRSSMGAAQRKTLAATPTYKNGLGGTGVLVLLAGIEQPPEDVAEARKGGADVLDDAASRRERAEKRVARGLWGERGREGDLLAP